MQRLSQKRKYERKNLFLRMSKNEFIHVVRTQNFVRFSENFAYVLMDDPNGLKHFQELLPRKVELQVIKYYRGLIL